MNSTSTTDRQATPERLLTLLFVFEIALIASTWPLWFKNTAFPQVPLLSIALSVPFWIDQSLASLLVMFCVAGIWCCGNQSRGEERSRKAGWVCIAGSVFCGSILVVLNQHRLQPWHWLFLLLQIQTLLTHSSLRITLHRLTFASIYIFAGLSRMGPQVATGISPQVLHTILGFAGLSQLATNEAFAWYGCLAMSITETAVGLALILQKTRRPAAIAAVMIHGMLLLALSPLGLNHHWGVLLWNLFLLFAIPISFWQNKRTADAENCSRKWNISAVALAIVVLGFPASSLIGVGDNWPGWQLYSPRTDVVQLLIRTEDTDLLPDSCQKFVGPPLLLQDVCPVRIDRWSLSETRSPLYPEDRFQLAVIAELIRNIDPASVRIALTTASTPDWWNQKRIEFQPQSPSQLQDRFLLNTATRRFD